MYQKSQYYILKGLPLLSRSSTFMSFYGFRHTPQFVFDLSVFFESQNMARPHSPVKFEPPISVIPEKIPLMWLSLLPLMPLSMLFFSVSVPQRANLVIILDIQSGYEKYIKSITENLLDGISLRKYRIAFYTTYGIADGILDFQSKECIVKKLR